MVEKLLEGALSLSHARAEGPCRQAAGGPKKMLLVVILSFVATRAARRLLIVATMIDAADCN